MPPGTRADLKNMDDHAQLHADQLIRMTAGGGREAFSRVYDLFAPLVFSLALRILRDRPEAEDLVQEVFIQVWREAERYDSALGAPEAWIITIARSRGIDRIRSRRRRRESPLPDEISRTEESAEGVGGVDPIDQLGVRGALAGLPVAQRTVIELAYFNGLTQSEIAAHLNIPLGTVKTRVRSTIARLRELMGAIPPGDSP